MAHVFFGLGSRLKANEMGLLPINSNVKGAVRANEIKAKTTIVSKSNAKRVLAFVLDEHSKTVSQTT